MMTGYETQATLHDGEHVEVSLCRRLHDGKLTIVKRVRAAALTPLHRARLKHEYDVLLRLASLRVEGIPVALELVDAPGVAALVTEALDQARSLRVLLAQGALTMDQAMHVASHVALVLADMHRHGFVHKQIHPAHIVFDRKSERVALIDFSRATLARLETRAAEGIALRQGDEYLAPEQTGRTPHAVDARSDLYGLGAVLYELLTGRQAIANEGPTNLVYAILAKVPRPAAEVQPAVPRSVSQIVSKLLEKAPERRYQTARSLSLDFGRCGSDLGEEFELGSYDQARAFSMSPLLCGRDAALRTLSDALASTLQGQREVVLVTGDAGVGKTRMLTAVQQRANTLGVRLACGVCEEARRNVPFAPISAALSEWLGGILALPNRDAFRRAAQEAVGSLGGAMIGVVPRLTELIGEQPPTPVLGAKENENRLLVLWQRLLGALGELSPVLLAFEDLQWADVATLNLLAAVSHDTTPRRGLLLLLSARPEPLQRNPQLRRTLQRLRSGTATVRTVALEPLSMIDLVRWVEASTAAAPRDARQLAALLHAKTSGYPASVQSALMELHRKELLQFDSGRQRWTWDLAAIVRERVAESTGQVFEEQLHHLSPVTQQVLGRAACIGRVFSTETLAATGPETRFLLESSLQTLVALGALVPAGDAASVGLNTGRALYRFAHDEVRKVAYDRLPQEVATRHHRAIGHALLLQPGAVESTAWLFGVVDQLNLGVGAAADVR
ncbi:MAG TPA: AAA family ATPase, partial [Myxococcota bacterium]|nr:AAA family ATPase [Myxococcota bacterium]